MAKMSVLLGTPSHLTSHGRPRLSRAKLQNLMLAEEKKRGVCVCKTERE